ncbi:MAG: MerR family transcriptional regulator [Candidatus Berkelbacteria bacterium]|nr:MerR family transcriptional regulator [Candidatus Berkelbacteria bacterium]
MSVTSVLIRIGEAAKDLGVTTQTLRNWEKTGKLQPRRSPGGQRLYERVEIERLKYNLRELGLAWAISAQTPAIPDNYYCERSDRFTSRLDKISVDLLAKLGDISLVSLLTLLVGEIGDNSFTHNLGNWPDVPGIFFAYDLYHRYIVLADRGRGIRATLQPIRPTSTDTEALIVAFTEIVSGRSPEKRGNGLKVVRRVVENQEGISLYLRSGLGIVELQGGQGKMQTSTADQNVRGVYAIINF